jgi:DNA polymerase-4
MVAPLLRAAWTKRLPLRLVSIRFSNVEEPATQLEMFGQGEDKKRRLAAVLDKLNAKGTKGVVHGHQLKRGEE